MQISRRKQIGAGSGTYRRDRGTDEPHNEEDKESSDLRGERGAQAVVIATVDDVDAVRAAC